MNPRPAILSRFEFSNIFRRPEVVAHRPRLDGPYERYNQHQELATAAYYTALDHLRRAEEENAEWRKLWDDYERDLNRWGFLDKVPKIRAVIAGFLFGRVATRTVKFLRGVKTQRTIVRNQTSQ